MKILMLFCNSFPYPPTIGATEYRAYHLLKYFHPRYEVTVFTRLLENTPESDIAELKKLASHVVLFPPRKEEENPTGLAGVLTKAGRFLESWQKVTPPNVLSYRSAEIQAKVDEYVREGKCDVIFCEHAVNELFIRPEYRQKVKTVVDIHSSIYNWVRNHLEHGATESAQRDRLYLPLLYRYEQRYCAKFDQLVSTTKEERQKLLQISPGSQITVIPSGTDLERFPYRSQDPGGHNLIFAGNMGSTHNIDAAVFFAKEIFPKVRAKYSDATLTFVGASPAPKVQELAQQPGIIVTGRVPSIAEYFHQATVCVVPLRVGIGIKTKTLEAMAAGVPVVATDSGLENLSVDEPGVPLKALRANSEQEFLDAIAKLFENPSLRQEISQNARAMIDEEYTWEKAGEMFDKVLHS